MAPNDPDRLETVVGDMLRRLPERRAPRTLEARVMAEISRRAALPWWRRSYASWPLAAKAGFVATCVAAAALVVLTLFAAGSSHAAHSLSGSLSSAYATVTLGRDLAEATASWLKARASALPAPVFYGAIAAVVSAYAALAAIGAATLRLAGTRNETR